MTRSWLAAVTLMSGIAMSGIAAAQSTTETTTTTTSAAPVVVPAPIIVPAPVVVAPVPAAPTSVVDTTRQRTIDQNGVITEQTRTTSQGSAVSPYGDVTTTRKTTETHTVQ